MRSLTALVGLCLVCGASAQNYPQPYDVSFSSAGAATVQFDFDISDTLMGEPTLNHTLLYRDWASAVWNSAAMNPLYETCSTLTMSTQIAYTPASTVLKYQFRSENDDLVISQCPNNATDAFPVPAHLMADLGMDATGDVMYGGGSHLDITHCYAAYSDTRVFFRLDNVGGGFPTNSGLFDYFAYAVFFADPDGNDDAGFAMIDAGLTSLFTAGLYRFDLVTFLYSRIADISIHIEGNSLTMSCDLSDITSHPDWSTWPPASGFIAVLPLTASLSYPELELLINDQGKWGFLVPESYSLDYTMNTAPILSEGNAHQDSQFEVSFEVTYADPDSNLPVVRDLIAESVRYPMVACVKDHGTGSVYQYALTVAQSGWYHYWFEFSDGAATVATNVDSVYVSVVEFLCGDTDASGAVNISDVIYLVSFMFGGPPPPIAAAGDVDCSGVTNMSDAVYLIGYIFGVNPSPCDPDGDEVPDC